MKRAAARTLTIAAIALLLVAAATAVLYLRAPTQVEPRASIQTLRHGLLTPQSLQGKAVLVTFWATTCSICLGEMPELVRLYERYRARGLEIVAVAMPYDQAWLVANYAMSRALPFPVAFDANGALVAAFGGVEGTPTAFLLDKRGVVRQRIEGRPDFVTLERRIARVLDET